MNFFRDIFGRKVNPNDAIFPILTGDKGSKQFKFLGTGFFINTFGGFLTAKHVLYNSDGSHINPFFAITTHEGKHYTRYLYKSFPHPTADICFGILRKDAHLKDEHITVDFKTPVMQILENEPVTGDKIQTFAYPNSFLEYQQKEQYGTFKGEWFKGQIKEILPYRDSTFYPYEVIQSSMKVLPGASGGPVMQDAYVIGVNSSGYDLDGTAEDISFLTPIKFAHEIEIEIKGEKFKLGDKRNHRTKEI